MQFVKNKNLLKLIPDYQPFIVKSRHSCIISRFFCAKMFEITKSRITFMPTQYRLCRPPEALKTIQSSSVQSSASDTLLYCFRISMIQSSF
jgi:hypothetical protein